MKTIKAWAMFTIGGEMVMWSVGETKKDVRIILGESGETGWHYFRGLGCSIRRITIAVDEEERK